MPSGTVRPLDFAVFERRCSHRARLFTIDRSDGGPPASPRVDPQAGPGAGSPATDRQAARPWHHLVQGGEMHYDPSESDHHGSRPIRCATNLRICDRRAGDTHAEAEAWSRLAWPPAPLEPGAAGSRIDVRLSARRPSRRAHVFRLPVHRWAARRRARPLRSGVHDPAGPDVGSRATCLPRARRHRVRGHAHGAGRVVARAGPGARLRPLPRWRPSRRRGSGVDPQRGSLPVPDRGLARDEGGAGDRRAPAHRPRPSRTTGPRSSRCTLGTPSCGPWRRSSTSRRSCSRRRTPTPSS